MTEEYGENYEQTQGGKGEGYPSPFASSQHAGMPAGSIPDEDPIADRLIDSESENVSQGFATDGDEDEVFADDGVPSIPRLGATRGGRRLVKPGVEGASKINVSPQQRLLILDTWRRSGLPAGDFAELVNVSKHTLYAWKKRFEEQGPAGLMDQPRGARAGSRLPELTKRTILMLKESNPEWGCERISDMLTRGPALPASASAVGRVLHEAGYQLEEAPTRPHPDKVRSFERAKPN